VILVDAGPLLALLDPRDPAHSRVVPIFGRGGPDVLLAVSLALAEVAYFLLRRVGTRAEASLLRAIATGQIQVVDPIPADYGRAADLVEKYADFPLGTVDALIAAMAERMEITTLFTLDRRHFGAIQPAHCERFTLVP